MKAIKFDDYAGRYDCLSMKKQTMLDGLGYGVALESLAMLGGVGVKKT